MYHEFVFTPADVYRIILASAGFIVALAGAIKVITDIIQKAKEPDKIQNDRITNLENRMVSVEKSVKSYGDHQHRAEEAWILYMQALSDVMDHMIYGNHTDNLKATQKKMREYMARNAFVVQEREG